jgi:hypothetical protein
VNDTAKSSSAGLVWIQFPVLIRLSRLHKTGFVEGFDIRVVKQNLVQVLFKQTKKPGLTKPGTGFVLSFPHQLNPKSFHETYMHYSE